MGGVLGVAAFGGAVRALGAAKASALPSFTPAATTLVSIPVLGRLPTLLELLGMGLATLGLLLAILGPGPRRAGPRPPGTATVGLVAVPAGRERDLGGLAYGACHAATPSRSGAT
jgi:drug/metabolite transporter (DMT)-like permease